MSMNGVKEGLFGGQTHVRPARSGMFLVPQLAEAIVDCLACNLQGRGADLK